MSAEPQVTLGWNLPAPASWKEMEDLLADALLCVSRGDSFEGTISWLMPTDEPWLQDADCGVVARYRIGNRDGQGGMRSFTRDVPESQVVIEGRPMASLERQPGMSEAIKLVKFLVSLENDVQARAEISLQQIIDMAKETYAP